MKKKEKQFIRELAVFRYNLRRFLRFSEKAARAAGVTPQQHQLMLGIAGFTEHGSATISDLAEFLQERNNSVVGLVERAVERGLVRRRSGKMDRRQVVVTLTPRGEEILAKLTHLHRDEARRVQAEFLKPPQIQRTPAADRAKGKAARKGEA